MSEFESLLKGTHYTKCPNTRNESEKMRVRKEKMRVREEKMRVREEKKYAMRGKKNVLMYIF